MHSTHVDTFSGKPEWKECLQQPLPEPLVDLAQPVNVSTGYTYDIADDPKPCFTYIAPKWRRLVKGTSQRAPARAALQVIKRILKSQKVQKFKLRMSARIKRRPKPIAISPRRMPQRNADNVAHRGPSQSAFALDPPAFLDPPEFLEGSTACNTPTRVCPSDPMQKAFVKGKGKCHAPSPLPAIIIPARQASVAAGSAISVDSPGFADSARSDSIPWLSDSSSPGLWIEIPPGPQLKSALNMQSLKRSFKRVRLPTLRLPAPRKGSRLDLVLQRSLIRVGFSRSNTPIQLNPISMDYDSAYSVPEVYYPPVPNCDV